MSNAARPIDRVFDAMELRLHELRSVEHRWSGFAAIWWDIGLVATPARAVLAIASVYHDALATSFDYAALDALQEQVVVGFERTRHTHSRQLGRRDWERYDDGKRIVRNFLAWIDRAEWPTLPRWAKLDRVESYGFDVADLQLDAAGDVTSSYALSGAALAQPQSDIVDALLYARGAILRTGLGIPNLGTLLGSIPHTLRYPPSKTPRQRADRSGRRKRKRGRS